MAAASPYAIRPSFAPVWGHCSAAIIASSQFPNLESEESREGDAAHWVIADCLEGVRDRNASEDCSTYLDGVAPNGVVITDKIVDGAQVFVDEVLAVAGEHLPNLMIEQQVHVTTVHPQNGGSFDAGLYIPERRVLFLWDYKHGHLERNAVEDLQMVDYAEGLRIGFNIDGQLDQETTLVARIVQPYCYRTETPISEWSGPLSMIRPYVNQLHAKAAEALTNPLMSAGKHCRYCPASRPCSNNRRAVYDLADYMNQPYQVDEMNTHDLAVERGILEQAAAILKDRREAIDEDLKHRIENGETGSGLSLQGSYGYKEWTIEPDKAIAIASQFGFDISKKTVLTPTQAIAAAPKEVRAMFEQVVADSIQRPPRGLKLVEQGDSRTARAFQPKPGNQ